MTRFPLSIIALLIFVSPAGAMTQCPDGTYVGGSGCQQAPDGTYISAGADPVMAPNGRYTAGPPQLTPQGNYVSGNGTVTMCPDGTFVAGTCTRTPDGKYVGD